MYFEIVVGLVKYEIVGLQRPVVLQNGVIAVSLERYSSLRKCLAWATLASVIVNGAVVVDAAAAAVVEDDVVDLVFDHFPSAAVADDVRGIERECCVMRIRLDDLMKLMNYHDRNLVAFVVRQ